MNKYIDYTQNTDGTYRIFSTHDYTRYNGSRDLILRVKYNTKYLLYDLNGERIHYEEQEPATVLETVNVGSDIYVVFLDKKHTLCFSKIDSSVDVQEYVTAIATPFNNINTIKIENDNKLVITGYSTKIKNQRILDLSEIAFGYENQLSTKLEFVYPKALRWLYLKTKFKFLRKFLTYKAEISFSKLYQHYLETSEINIPMFLKRNLHDNNEHSFIQAPLYATSSRDIENNRLYTSKSYLIENTDNELYLKYNDNRQGVVVMTEKLDKNVYENESKGYKLAQENPVKDRYIYFEKFAQGASESAYLMFEYAMQQNDDLNNIYILNENDKMYPILKDKYPDNVYAKNSVEAFYNIFKAKYLISSDTSSHIQRRLYDNSKHIKEAIINAKRVFLQHGPSLCTNVFTRGYYSSTGMFASDYIVVCSEKEKQLFLDNTFYTDEQLLLTGIPNFDDFVNYRLENKPKDEITIMLTYRPWDITGTVEPGSYIDRYLTFIKMVKEDSFFNDKKVNIVLHPKAKQVLSSQFKEEFDSIEKYLYEGDIKTATLKSSVFITDYSSLMFFAFAGGSNVICYWEDKAEAEEHYGSPNIMQEPICFGDIAYDLTKVIDDIKQRYLQPQDEKYLNIYNDLVTCHFNDNTENTYKALFEK